MDLLDLEVAKYLITCIIKATLELISVFLAAGEIIIPFISVSILFRCTETHGAPVADSESLMTVMCMFSDCGRKKEKTGKLWENK